MPSPNVYVNMTMEGRAPERVICTARYGEVLRDTAKYGDLWS